MARELKSRIIVFVLVTVLWFLVSNTFAQTESITLTTYYPSPFGEYQRLRLFPSAQPTCDANNVGLMYYDIGTNRIRYCDGLIVPNPDWSDIGGGGGWTDDGTVVRLTTATDNVGIGTATPITKLHVNGQSLWLTGGNSGFLGAAAGQGLRMYYDDANDRASIFAYDYPTGAVSNIILNEGGGNIGIAMPNPRFRLHIVSEGLSSGLGIQPPFTLPATDTGIQFLSAGIPPGGGVSNSRIIARDQARELTFETGGNQERMRINSAGNVGIGTNNPTAKLEVAGDITISGSETDFWGKGIIFDKNAATTNKWHIGITSEGLNFAETGEADYRLYLRDGGNVGIGTTNPQALLQVGASDTTSAWQIISGGGSGTPEGGELQLETAADWDGTIDAWILDAYQNDFRIHSAGTLRFIIDENGNAWHSGSVTSGGGCCPDISEDIPSAKDVESADIVVIDPENNERVIKSSKPYDTTVAGIISTSPAFLIDMKDSDTPLALAGRVSCKVITENGPIKRGDLLVTSSKPGYAMKASTEKLGFGMIIGKALEPLEQGEGKITVLVNVN